MIRCLGDPGARRLDMFDMNGREGREGPVDNRRFSDDTITRPYWLFGWPRVGTLNPKSQISDHRFGEVTMPSMSIHLDLWAGRLKTGPASSDLILDQIIWA